MSTPPSTPSPQTSQPRKVTQLRKVTQTSQNAAPSEPGQATTSIQTAPSTQNTPSTQTTSPLQAPPSSPISTSSQPLTQKENFDWADEAEKSTTPVIMKKPDVTSKLPDKELNILCSEKNTETAVSGSPDPAMGIAAALHTEYARSRVDTPSTDDKDFVPVSNKSRRHKGERFPVDTTRFEEKTTNPPTTDSPTTNAPTTAETVTIPSESAFPGLPHTESRTDPGVVASSTPSEFSTGFVNGVIQSQLRTFGSKVDMRIAKEIAKFAKELDDKLYLQQEAQEMWNERIEEAVITSVEKIQALEVRVRDLEMGQDALEDSTKAKFDDLEQRLRMLETRDTVSEDSVDSRLDEICQDLERVREAAMDLFADGDDQAKRMDGKLASLEDRIVALESHTQAPALSSRQRPGYQRGEYLRR